MKMVNDRCNEEKMTARATLQNMLSWVYLQIARSIKLKIWTDIEKVWTYNKHLYYGSDEILAKYYKTKIASTSDQDNRLKQTLTFVKSILSLMMDFSVNNNFDQKALQFISCY